MKLEKNRIPDEIFLKRKRFTISIINICWGPISPIMRDKENSGFGLLQGEGDREGGKAKAKLITRRLNQNKEITSKSEAWS